jgi:hypothetical protein
MGTGYLETKQGPKSITLELNLTPGFLAFPTKRKSYFGPLTICN